MSKRNDDRKTVVVVGAGQAGAALARALSQKLSPAKYNLILLSPRPYFIYMIAGCRITTSGEDKLENTALIPLDRLFVNGNGTFKQGTVATIEPSKNSQGGTLNLKSGEKVNYDVLALSPGMIWDGPLAFPEDPEEVKTFIKNERDAFAKANHIVCIGGGAVGIEFAGEIKDVYPRKKVTIVQGDSQLMNKTYPAKFRAAMEQSVRNRGIEIVFNDYVDEIPSPGQPVTTRNGKTIDADLAISTRGPRPNGAFIASLGSDALSQAGYVKVRPTLQLQAHDDIFALGDVIDWDEQKQAAKAGAHVGVVTANIISVLDGRTPAKLYKGSPELIIITNGKQHGGGYFGILWGIVVGDWISKFLKSKDLMIPQVRKSIGY